MFLRQRSIQEIIGIVIRNVFVFINAVIFIVAALLFFFGDRESAFFIAIILVLNIILGLIQELRAWFALEKLQQLTAHKATRIFHGKKEEVPIESVKENDILALQVGDQVSCDGTLHSSAGLEVNKSLLTGESASFPLSVGAKIYAGYIVTAGSGTLRVEKVYQESRIMRMTEGIKKYEISISPIQRDLQFVISALSYVLFSGLLYIAARGYALDEPVVRQVKEAGALASALIPQGLVFAVTLAFAYGAANLFRKDVLLQEVNATEKLGRIQHLCMDKTGTLTENALAVKEMYTWKNENKEAINNIVATYIAKANDSSQTAQALSRIVKKATLLEPIETLPFSSWRQYGAMKLNDASVIYIGNPDIFRLHIKEQANQEWLTQMFEKEAQEGRTIIAVARTNQTVSLKEISALDIIATFVIESKLRPGISESVNFFQNRGVRIRILSGDNAQTVRAVCSRAGVLHTDKTITGKEMDAWSDKDFAQNVSRYTIFARLKPEQKEKIISAFKRTGFTAMIGDGANDALAIKRADLGIALFSGASASRQLASVVLMKNSFSALPQGVRLADNIIVQLEILASLFFYQVGIALFTFVILTCFGESFPFTPLNITLINYLTVGIPSILISYWVIFPPHPVEAADSRSFFRNTLPLSFALSFVGALGASAVYFSSDEKLLVSATNPLVLVSFIVFGLMFLWVSPWIISGYLTFRQSVAIILLWIAGLSFLYLAFKIPLFSRFFEIFSLSPLSVVTALFIDLAFGLLMFRSARHLMAKTSL